ncbi:MAG: hypothetical protein GY851_18275 [bacterium]|nr:hypothetical protein [bacterium]
MSLVAESPDLEQSVSSSRITDRFPKEMREYFDLRWRPERLWETDVPVHAGRVAHFRWHLDYPFWASRSPSAIFDLRPRDVLLHPETYPVRYARIEVVDVSFPVETVRFGSLLVILDGLHRLANLVRREEDVIRYRIVPRSLLAARR